MGLAVVGLAVGGLKGEVQDILQGECLKGSGDREEEEDMERPERFPLRSPTSLTTTNAPPVMIGGTAKTAKNGLADDDIYNPRFAGPAGFDPRHKFLCPGIVLINASRCDISM